MILNDTLYKRGFSMPYLKCIDEKEAKYILEEIHKGICRDHAGTRSLVSKVIRTGYFWPTLQKGVREFVKKCDKCQMFRNVQRIPIERLTPIASLWLFAQWGIDIVSPLPQGKRQKNFASHYWLFHKMGWSKSTINHHRGKDLELRVEEHSLPIQDTTDDHIE